MRMRRVRCGTGGGGSEAARVREGLAGRSGRRERGSVPERTRSPPRQQRKCLYTLTRTSLFLRLVLRTQDTSRRCARAVAWGAAGAVRVPGARPGPLPSQAVSCSRTALGPAGPWVRMQDYFSFTAVSSWQGQSRWSPDPGLRVVLAADRPRAGLQGVLRAGRANLPFPPGPALS